MVINILQERLKIGVIKPSHGLYQNLWYLVKKSTPEKYQLVIIIVELIHSTIKNTNLLLSINEFSEKFAGYTIFSLIYFVSDYNQVELDKESQILQHL